MEHNKKTMMSISETFDFATATIMKKYEALFKETQKYVKWDPVVANSEKYVSRRTVRKSNV